MGLGPSGQHTVLRLSQNALCHPDLFQLKYIGGPNFRSFVGDRFLLSIMILQGKRGEGAGGHNSTGVMLK